MVISIGLWRSPDVTVRKSRRMDLPSTPVAQNSRSKSLYWAIALTLAAVLLYYSLRGIDWRQVWLTLKTARLIYIAFSALIGVGSLSLRALRWRVLLQSG